MMAFLLFDLTSFFILWLFEFKTDIFVILVFKAIVIFPMLIFGAGGNLSVFVYKSCEF
jgi:hypothetical protein